METRDGADQHAHRWAELMKLCGLRGRVFAPGEDPENEDESGRRDLNPGPSGPKPESREPKTRVVHGSP